MCAHLNGRTLEVQSMIRCKDSKACRLQKAAAGGVPVYGIKNERAARAWDAYEAVGKKITNG